MRLSSFILAALLAHPLPPSSAGAGEPLALMPRVEDYTLMHWAEGFPSHTPTAPWRRVIQTGRFALALDTETLRIPHFGPIPPGTDYAAAARSGNGIWQALPGAELSLSLTADGKRYHCTSGEKWSQHAGPRLIESGRLMQRADVTDLTFEADDGKKLNVEARFETVAWPDRLALVLAAKPGNRSFPAGEPCFGRVKGGFGLDGTNHLEIAHRAELEPEQFTLELWAYIPSDPPVSARTFPWLACKNAHEQADGNYGLVIVNGRPGARMNIGGGRENAYSAEASPRQPLKIEAWNHLSMSYDGETLRLHVNGAPSGEVKIGRPRTFGKSGLAFGRRQDNSGDGYHFRGALDEIHLYDRALSDAEIRERFLKPEIALPSIKPVWSETFADDGKDAVTRPGELWKEAAMEIRFATAKGELHREWKLPKGEVWSTPAWHEVALAFEPVSFLPEEPVSPVTVKAGELPGGKDRKVEYEPVRGWHRIDLNGIEPIVPAGGYERNNDAIERVKLALSNPSDREQVARLLFEKSAGGFRQRIGTAITGISAILRDAGGEPTGIPVQLSKNWHNRPEGDVYSGQWFHGFSQVRLPPGALVELEITLAYGHWGGVAAASHAQLSLIGWGSNQLWDQSALGSWGESICYEPDQAQGSCSILDVRPVMVASMNKDAPWGWTHNVGGGDFFRFFDKAGTRIHHTAMRAAYERYGPCLTEVTYAGRIGTGIDHRETVCLTRSDDLLRGTYRIRLDVKEAIDFSRFVLFQIGADTYSYTAERKMALGNESGLVKEWPTNRGGDVYRTTPVALTGPLPWVSLHEGESRRRPDEAGAWANRGIVIRSWKARLGGHDAAPWIAERGVSARQSDTSTIDILPPPGVTRLEAGDFVEATIEHLIVPQFAGDYYGPNEALRAALRTDGNTWRLIQREAVGNDRRVVMKVGTLRHTHPAITIETDKDHADAAISGGLGYVAITFSGLTSPHGYELSVNDQVVDQSVHGNDFWQTDYDPVTKRWSRTYNVPMPEGKTSSLRFSRKP